MPRCAITVDKNVHFDLQGVHVASARENANSRRVQVSVKIFRSIITTRFGKHGSRRLTLCRNFQNRRAADGHWNGNFIVMEFFVFEDFFVLFSQRVNYLVGKDRHSRCWFGFLSSSLRSSAITCPFINFFGTFFVEIESSLQIICRALRVNFRSRKDKSLRACEWNFRKFSARVLDMW